MPSELLSVLILIFISMPYFISKCHSPRWGPTKPVPLFILSSPSYHFFFFTSLTTSRCAHFPQNINCWFDFSFLVSLSRKLPEVPKLPASAGVQDSQQVSIAVRFASESPGSEKHQIPIYLLWLPGIYTHTSEFQHILGTCRRFETKSIDVVSSKKRKIP